MGIFLRLLKECGVELSDDDSNPHIIRKEKSLVKRDLERKLEKEDVNAFINEMKDYCNDDGAFQMLLSKTALEKPNKERAPFLQASIVHIILTIDSLQPSILAMVMDKLTEKIVDEDQVTINLILNSISLIPVIHDESSITTKLLDNIDVGDIQVKLELLHYLPMIVSSKQNDRIAERMLLLIEEDEVLREHIMANLVVFSLSNETKTKLTSFIFSRMLNTPRYYKIFHLLFYFLMKHNDNKLLVLSETHSALDRILSGPDVSEDIKLSLHTKLFDLARATNELNAAIMKYELNELKPIDVYLTILVYITSKSKDKLAFVKKRANANVFKPELLEAFFARCFIPQVMQDFHRDLMNLAFKLIESHRDANNFGEIGARLFRLLFAHERCDVGKRKMLIFNLKSFMHLEGDARHLLIVRMLQELSTDGVLAAHASNLMSFLELKHVLSLHNFKHLFDVLCANVMRSGDNVDELRQVVAKLLHMHQPAIVKKGIVAAILMAKHLSMTTTHVAEPGADSPTASARVLLELACQKCTNFPERLGLYNDELALAISKDMDAAFLQWLNAEILEKFQNVYVVFGEQQSSLPIALKPQYELNAATEMDVALYMNIGEFVQKPTMTSMIIVLSPLFRLLRVLKQHTDSCDMEDIDALLGCGVLMPDLEDLEIYGQDDLKVVADCLFHTINWFRELVSAFVSQTQNTCRIKVIQRVKHIVELEDKLEVCLGMLAEYKLPMCNFYEDHSPYKSARMGPPGPKRSRNESVANTTAATSSSTTRPSTNRAFECNFRQIDSDVNVLLKYPVLSPEMTASQMKSLHAKQFQFILRVSLGKLHASLNKTRVYSTNLSAQPPEQCLIECEKLLPYVHKHFRQVAHELATILENNDYCYDADVIFEPTSNDLKQSFDLVIEFYKLIFSWSGWTSDKHQELLRKFLRYFHASEKTVSLDESIHASLIVLLSHNLIEELIENISKYKMHCLLLSSASGMIELMQELRQLLQHSTSKSDKIIVQTASGFLKKRWLTSSGNVSEAGKLANRRMEVIVGAYLEDATVQTISGIVGTLQEEVANVLNKKNPLNVFRAIDKGNIHILYKCICRELVKKLKLELRHLTNNEHLVLWRNTAMTLQGLIRIAKTLKTNNNIKTFSMYSLSTINVFLARGIPMMDIMLRKKPADVQEILSILQTTTLFLHRLCCQVVHRKSAGYFSIVPQVRTTLEKLVCSVQAIFVGNKCNEAYWAGVLKNRDIEGEEILSQVTMTDDGDEEDDEEDEDTEEGNLSDSSDVYNHSDNASVQSASEVFT